MIERVRTEEGIVMYQSSALREWGVPHAFSTRIGGISPPPFDSMNLGNPNGCAVQDDEERIQENYRKLHEVLESTWDMFEVMTGRIAHLVSLEEAGS